MLDPIVALWRQLTRGLTRLVRPRDVDRDLSDEISHFLDQATRANIAAGMTPDHARRAAHLALGNRTTIEEGVRMAFWENAVSSVITDVRYAVRMLGRTPVFTIVVVAVISVGTGAVTTMFSGVNAFLLRPLPGVGDPAGLVMIDRIEPGAKGGTQASFPYHRAIRARTRTLTSVGAYGKLDLTISTGGAGQQVYGNLVSGNFFAILGIQPALGRFFVPPEDSVPLANPVIVVSHEFWRSKLGADSAVVGKTISVNGHPFTLIGVAPSGFRGVQVPIVTSAWVPLMMTAQLRPGTIPDSPSAAWLWQFGRIKEGIDRDAVLRELVALTEARIAEGVEPEWMKKNSEIRLIGLTGLPDDAQKTMAAFTGVLLAAAFLVLLIASVNVAAMLSARAMARRHEMAIRLALGAARGRLVRQLVTESLVLFTLGAAGGIVIALLATRALEQVSMPMVIPLALDLTPDFRVLSFALFVSLLTGGIFGLTPALRVARQDITTRLRDDARGGGRRSVVSNALVVGQLALSLVLLVSAGLLLRALDRGNRVDPGFDAIGVMTASFKPDAWGYDSVKARAFYRTVRERAAALPGVTAVSFTSRLPLQLSSSSDRIQPNGEPAGPDNPLSGTPVQMEFVDAGYFDVLKLPIAAGRAFALTDDGSAPKVAIVNETFVKKLWPDGNPVGRVFGFHRERITVVGIARDAKYQSLTESTPPFAYFPLAQQWRQNQTLVVRASGTPAALATAIRNEVTALDLAIPLPEVATLTAATSFVLLPQRVAALVAGSLGLLGLILATVGLYGIISYSVSRRSREIGVRMALGARAADVQGMVVREGMRLAGYGVAAGLLLSAGVSRLLGAYLYGVSPLDAPTFIGMSAVFVIVALLASWLPARRAAAANPLVALREG